MSLIPQEDLLTLQSASAVKEVAETAVYEQDIQAVAYAINSAANTGETKVVINSKLSSEVVEELKANGYTLTYNVARANIHDEVCISWESADNVEGDGAGMDVNADDGEDDI